MADKKENIIQTLSAETDAKYAAGKAVEEIVRRIVRAQDTDSIDKVLVISGGCLRLADISLFKIEYTLTVVAMPVNATITINGVQTDSVTVTGGAAAIVTVEATGYLPYNQTVIVNGDMTLNVILEMDYITVTPSSFVLNNSASSGNVISVSTPGTWTALPPSWITLSSTSGNGDSQITFSAEENPETISRVDSIIFTSQTGITASVSVDQEAKEAELLTASTSLSELGYDGGTFTLNITSNTSWTITSSGSIGLSYSSTSGTGDATVTVTYSRNSSPETVQSGVITITTVSGQTSVDVSLSQRMAEASVELSEYYGTGAWGESYTTRVTVGEYTDSLRFNVDFFVDSTTYRWGISNIRLSGSNHSEIININNTTVNVTRGESFDMTVETLVGTDYAFVPYELLVMLYPSHGSQERHDPITYRLQYNV